MNQDRTQLRILTFAGVFGVLLLAFLARIGWELGATFWAWLR